MPTNTSVELDELLADLDLTPVLTPKTSVPPVVPAPSIPAIADTASPVDDDRAAFYALLAVEEAEKLRAATNRIHASRSSTAANLIVIGLELIAIRTEIPGHFEEWLQLEFSMSRSSAYNYMRVAIRFGEVPQVLEVLPMATAYRLAAKATPADIRDAVVREIAAGRPVSAEEVEERISEATAKPGGEKRIVAQRKKPKHPPAANDDAKSKNTGNAHVGSDKIATEPANTDVNAFNLPEAVLGATDQRQKADVGGSDRGPADGAAREALALLRRYLAADAFQTLEMCAASDVTWNALRCLLVENEGLTVAA